MATLSPPPRHSRRKTLRATPPTHAELVEQVARVIWETPHPTESNGSFDGIPWEWLDEESQNERRAEAEAALRFLAMDAIFPLWVQAMTPRTPQTASAALENVGALLAGRPIFELQEPRG